MTFQERMKGVPEKTSLKYLPQTVLCTIRRGQVRRLGAWAHPSNIYKLPPPPSLIPQPGDFYIMW